MEYIIKWRNQGGVKESGMSKWILQLRDDKGTLIKTVEDTTASNLENFSDVEIRMTLTQEEVMSQTATNKMMIYFDSVRDSTKLGELTVLFDRSRLSLDIASIARSDVTIPTFSLPVGSKFKCSSNDPFGSNNSSTYEHVGNNEIKYVLDSASSSIDCGSLKYTGKLIQRTFDGRCGVGKRCPGTQCCSRWGWCAGSIGTMDDWYCMKSQKITDKYSTWNGEQLIGSGNDIKNMKITVSSSPNPISTSGRCGASFGRCPGNQCCSRWNWCGGSIGTYSANCTEYKWPEGYVGYHSELDGDGNSASSPTTIKTVPIHSEPIVFKCATYDPLGRDNTTIYKWENESLKNISSVPPGYQIYNLPNCDGIEYGGPG